MTTHNEIAEIIVEFLGVTNGDADHAARAIVAHLHVNSGEKVQYGVAVEYEGRQYVDTAYNGGFRSAQSALYAADDGYTKGAQTKAVQRTITTIYGPWTPITEGETDGNRPA